MRVIGLMSGTSADGVDAALVEWGDAPGGRPFRLLAQLEEPFEPDLQQRIHRLAAGRSQPGETLRELALLDVLLGERFAAAAIAVAARAGIALDDVDAIASHGQTVAHHPERRATLQIGDPSVIAERTGLTTVADFRTRDVAAGGQGAPLAPFFNYTNGAGLERTRRLKPPVRTLANCRVPGTLLGAPDIMLYLRSDYSGPRETLNTMLRQWTV